MDPELLTGAASSQEGELEELEKGVEPTWGKLVEPLERITDRLEVIWGMVDHLKAVKDSADLRAAVEEVQVHLSYPFLLFVSSRS
jgi:oligopeptidase A